MDIYLSKRLVKTLIYKVDDKIVQEFDMIKEAEGLGNRTATFSFLIKYYLLTKQNSLDNSIALLDKLIENRIDVKNLPSAKDQLAEI